MAIPFGSDIDLKNNKIKNAKVDTPSEAEDITNKDYVDNKVLDGSTVPVGSVIGFEGEEIPDGYELIEETTEDDTTEETTKILTSADNVNRVYEEGRYLCYYGDLPSNLPENSAGVLEVISSGQIVDHCIQKYYLEESQTTYERHISEELGAWHKIVKSDMFAILTGTITISSSSRKGSITFSYPSDFTLTNTVAISFGVANNWNGWNGTEFNFYGDARDGEIDYTSASHDRYVYLKSNQIQVWVCRPDSIDDEYSVNVKVVLMRIDI